MSYSSFFFYSSSSSSITISPQKVYVPPPGNVFRLTCSYAHCSSTLLSITMSFPFEKLVNHFHGCLRGQLFPRRHSGSLLEQLLRQPVVFVTWDRGHWLIFLAALHYCVSLKGSAVPHQTCFSHGERPLWLVFWCFHCFRTPSKTE